MRSRLPSRRPRPTGSRRSCAPQGGRQAAVLEAEGRAKAITNVYGAIKLAKPDPTLLAILQLEALGKVATSNNAKLVVPVESSGLVGAAQALKSMLDSVPIATNGAGIK